MGVLYFVIVLLCITFIVSSFATILNRKRESWLLCFIGLRMSCYCKCSVTPPQGAVVGLRCVIVVFLDSTHFFVIVLAWFL